MPDDAAKTTDAPARSAREPKILSARDAEASGAAARAADAPDAASAKATTAKPAAPQAAKAAHTDGGAAAALEPSASQSADDAAKPEPKLTMPAAPAGAAAKAATMTGDEATLFGGLDADARIRQTLERNERTLWTGAVAATLVYAALIGGQLATGLAVPVPMEQHQKERRGQDAPDSISVDIVPDPDKTSKTRRWQEGAQAQTPTPNQQPPQPQQTASLAQPEVQEVEKEQEKKDTDQPRDADSPMLLDIDSLVDAAAADFKRNLDHALAEKAHKKRRKRQAMVSGGGMQIRGTGASGRSDPFTRSVIAALMKTRPGPFALWGRVLVSFQVTESGKIAYVHLLQSSGNSALDQAAVSAIRRARFKRPPPGLTADDRTYIIDYIFG